MVSGATDYGRLASTSERKHEQEELFGIFDVENDLIRVLMVMVPPFRV